MKAKQFSYILIGILALLIIAGGYGYYTASQSLHNQTIKLSNQMAVDTVADERISQLIALRKQYQRFTPLIPNIDSALPAAKQQSEVALQLQTLASQAGMSLPSVTFASSNGLPTATSQTISAGGVLALPVTFQLTGTYDQMQRFLVSLENLGRYTAVTSLAITRADPKAKTLNFSLNVNVYVKP
jgi:Tfp pilus assembly protein PilO